MLGLRFGVIAASRGEDVRGRRGSSSESAEMTADERAERSESGE